MPSRHGRKSWGCRARLMSTVYADLGHAETCDSPGMALRLSEYEEQKKLLEMLTTAELRAIAEHEKAPIVPVFGKGQRKRFIDAIARKRAGV